MTEYTLYWIGGRKETVSGDTIADAFRSRGYGAGALKKDGWRFPEGKVFCSEECEELSALCDKIAGRQPNDPHI